MLENYSSFISKLETVYNTTIQNYNGLMATADILSNDKDNLYLKDKEYGYNSSRLNNDAKATAIINGSISSVAVTNWKGIYRYS